VTFARPTWSASQANAYAARFARFPGWRTFGFVFGLTSDLAAFNNLRFLSAGLLIGSYTQNQRTVFVYVVNQSGQNVEYRVDNTGNVIGQQLVL
jgi:hypothetical protein